jgi:hypothetical protein
MPWKDNEWCNIELFTVVMLDKDGYFNILGVYDNIDKAYDRILNHKVAHDPERKNIYTFFESDLGYDIDEAFTQINSL